MEEMKLGKIGLTLGGDYDSAKEYDKLVCVTHGGRSWVSRKAVPSGMVPSFDNVEYWQLVSERGEQGPEGPRGLIGLTGPRGLQGNSGYSGAAGELEVVNNLETDNAIAALSAKMGKELNTKVAQLDQDVPKLVDSDTADLEIADSQGNILVEFADGHIRTKNFNSRTSGATSSNSALAAKTWCSLGTSITWYNNNQGGRFEKGYQGWLMEKLPVGTLVNKGINGGTLLQLAGQLGNIVSADIYTIEHGVNDWGRKSVVGTIEDYINNTGASTFYGAYRIIIDAIYAKNSKAVIVLCTPRKSRGFNGYLPSSCNGELDGIKLKDYADAVMEVARYEGLPVCDWFNRCGVNDHNLPLYSIDDALHPNDLGYKQMAQLLIEQFNNIY